jgi:hypothetical protein
VKVDDLKYILFSGDGSNSVSAIFIDSIAFRTSVLADGILTYSVFLAAPQRDPWIFAFGFERNATFFLTH